MWVFWELRYCIEVWNGPEMSLAYILVLSTVSYEWSSSERSYTEWSPLVIVVSLLRAP